ncbi:hypothetical protein CQA40_00020 [Helicobacter sp. MIT 01-3238]|nr:hypothetical protein CQA40_00020 [Helicobacter sp. MIT 01-3238]
MKTIIFNDFFISTPYVKTLFRIKYTKEIKPFVLKSQLMFLDVQKSKKYSKTKILSKKYKNIKIHTKISKILFANLRNLNATLLF